MALPKAGDTYTFTADEPRGLDANALFPGTVVTVREVVDAGEPGAHDDSEDAVVVEWQEESRVRTDDGWGRGEVTRAVSIGVGEFGDLFTKGG